MEAVILTEGLTKRYGRTTALDGLDLEVRSGAVYGYLGPNGAGKTTTIRILMGLLTPTAGRAFVLGRDATAERDEVHRHVGYLPGDFVAYGDLTGAEYLRFLANLRSDVEWRDVDLLAKRFDLDLSRRVGTLSHGNRQKVGIVQAFMHQPDLVVLDEPTTGLDPLMQREFRALVREVRDAGRTVFLSSHVLDEVEAVADTVAILRGGRLVALEDLDALRAKARRRLDITFAGEPPVEALRAVPGVDDVQVLDRTAHVVVVGTMQELMRVAAAHGIERITSHEADLEEIFLTYYGGG